MTSDQDQLVQWSETLADAVEHASRWTVTVAAPREDRRDWHHGER